LVAFGLPLIQAEALEGGDQARIGVVFRGLFDHVTQRQHHASAVKGHMLVFERTDETKIFQLADRNDRSITRLLHPTLSSL
jgi:hypothetical protein